MDTYHVNNVAWSCGASRVIAQSGIYKLSRIRRDTCAFDYSSQLRLGKFKDFSKFSTYRNLFGKLYYGVKY